MATRAKPCDLWGTAPRPLSSKSQHLAGIVSESLYIPSQTYGRLPSELSGSQKGYSRPNAKRLVRAINSSASAANEHHTAITSPCDQADDMARCVYSKHPVRMDASACGRRRPQKRGKKREKKNKKNGPHLLPSRNRSRRSGTGWRRATAPAKRTLPDNPEVVGARQEIKTKQLLETRQQKGKRKGRGKPRHKRALYHRPTQATTEHISSTALTLPRM